MSAIEFPVASESEAGIDPGIGTPLRVELASLRAEIERRASLGQLRDALTGELAALRAALGARRAPADARVVGAGHSHAAAREAEPASPERRATEPSSGPDAPEPVGFAHGHPHEGARPALRGAASAPPRPPSETVPPAGVFAGAFSRASQAPGAARPMPAPLSAPGRLSALWTLAFRRDLRADGIGLFWWLAEPLVAIILATFAALLFQGAYTSDMPTFAFAVIGAVTWLAFRGTLTLTLGGIGNLVHALAVPRVTRFEIALARAPRALLTNALVGGAVMGVLVMRGTVRPPEDPLALAGALGLVAVAGLGGGLLAAHAAFLWPGIRRIVMVLLRLVGLASGLFYVSEQLPEGYAAVVLWNPVLHAAQIARDAWFTTYASADASWTYLAAWALGLLVLGLAAAIRDARTRAHRGEPV